MPQSQIIDQPSMGGYRRGQVVRSSGWSGPPEKSQVTIGFLRNSGTDPLEKQVDYCFSTGSLRPTEPYVDE